MSKNRKRSVDVGFWLLVLLALVLGYYALYGVNSGRTVTYAAAKQLFYQERV